jgi:hypothetical protein
MKTDLVVLCLLFAGCQSAPPAVRPLPDVSPLRTPPGNLAGQSGRTDAPPAAARENSPPPDTGKLTRQSQLIEALLAQNDVLTARLAAQEQNAAHAPATIASTPAAPVTPPLPVPPALAAVGATPPTAPSPPPDPTPLLVPNADGVIDTTVLPAAASPPNPFALRTLPAAAVREVSFTVQGVVMGPNPCALINGRIAGAGDAVESLRLARIAPESLVLTGDGFVFHLPLGATRVRLAL